MSKIDHFIYSEESLLEVEFPPSEELYRKIGKNVASLVRNGATLQVGMGKAPQAVLPELKEHKNLGVHTDSFFDGFVDLIEAGAITNEMKSVNKGRCIASFAIGTKKLFEFIDDNLGVEFHPASFTNNPLEIAKNSLMTSINSALSLDLLGQVNAESIDGKFYSGYGGLVDFCRGSMYADEGVSIICLPSTAKNNTISRIQPRLPSGEHISLTMADVHYVVTEYGIAQLHGKNIRERALALISISHPKFRQQLLEEAKKMNLCYPDQMLATDSNGKMVIYPDQFHSRFQTPSGEITFRPIRATDERLVQDLYYSLDNESRTYRFFRPKKFFSREDVKMDILIDYEQIMAIGGVIGEVGHEKIVATCSYEKENKTNLAEIAFTVHDEWRNLGLTKFMLQYLIKIAKQKGIQGFFGEIMWDNKAMAHIIKESGFEIKGYPGEDGWRFKFLF